MNNPFNTNPEALVEQGKRAAQNTVKAVTNQAKITAQTAVSQITGSDSGIGNSTQDAGQLAAQDASDKDFVQDLYAPTKTASDTQSAAPSSTQNAQSPSDQAKLAETRQKLEQLHKEYFENEFNKPKPQELAQGEKVEQEKMIEMQELQEKEQKKLPPVALQRAMTKAEVKGGGG
jgi:hypothetical protein